MDDYITIRELIAGGPAIVSGLLKPGDRIVGVAQGADGAMTDILGWRVDDAVVLIRGAADSVVRLDVLPADSGPDGKHRVVALVRKKIALEAQAARSEVRTVNDGKATRRIGVITLPIFYRISTRPSPRSYGWALPSRRSRRSLIACRRMAPWYPQAPATVV